jgi:hypothetical protein
MDNRNMQYLDKEGSENYVKQKKLDTDFERE